MSDEKKSEEEVRQYLEEWFKLQHARMARSKGLITPNTGISTTSAHSHFYVEPPTSVEWPVDFIEAEPEPEEEPVATIPDFTEPVLACRAWQYRQSVLPGRFLARLESLNQKEIWGSGVNKAECRVNTYSRHKSSAPQASCSCGIYAVSDPARLESWAQEYHIFGVVELWGRVIPAESGYRAEYARIRELITYTRSGARLDHNRKLARRQTFEIANAYGLKVKTDWPQLTDPSTLRREGGDDGHR